MAEAANAGAGAAESDDLAGKPIPFDPSAKPAKGILRKAGSSAKPLKWDEMNILMTEHPPGKDYGHMKIDEPPTPYEREYNSDDDMDEGENQDPREEPLDNAAVDKLVHARLGSQDGTWEDRQAKQQSDSDDTEMTPEAKAKDGAFRAKRKAHYNEFEMVKRMREKRKAGRKRGGDEDDEDEEEE